MHQQSQNRHLEASLNHKYRVAVLQQELGEHVYGAYGDERHRFHFGPHQIRPEDHRQILRVHFVQVGPLHHPGQEADNVLQNLIVVLRKLLHHQNRHLSQLLVLLPSLKLYDLVVQLVRQQRFLQLSQERFQQDRGFVGVGESQQLPLIGHLLQLSDFQRVRGPSKYSFGL
jgi:hypothetical protein